MCKYKNTDIEIIEDERISLPRTENDKLNCFGDLDNYYYFKRRCAYSKNSKGKKFLFSF